MAKPLIVPKNGLDSRKMLNKKMAYYTIILSLGAHND